MKLLARVFAPAADAEQARAFEQRLLAALAEFAPRATMAPVRYWKIPAWVEHTLELQPPTRASYEALRARCADGWHAGEPDEECSAVWCAAPDRQFLLPEVTWAELLLFHPHPPSAA